MLQENREEFVYRRAYELARSGVHISAITIVSALAEEGYPEASTILSGDLVRADLNRVCARHWPGVTVQIAERSSGGHFGHRQAELARRGAGMR